MKKYQIPEFKRLSSQIPFIPKHILTSISHLIKLKEDEKLKFINTFSKIEIESQNKKQLVIDKKRLENIFYNWKVDILMKDIVSHNKWIFSKEQIKMMEENKGISGYIINLLIKNSFGNSL